MNRYPYLLLFITLILLPGCKPREEKGPEILSEDQMVALLIDTHLADALLAKDPATVDRKRDMALYVYPSVLEKHAVTKAQMDSSVSWYLKHPKVYVRIYEKVMKDLEGRVAKPKPEPSETEE